MNQRCLINTFYISVSQGGINTKSVSESSEIIKTIHSSESLQKSKPWCLNESSKGIKTI